MGPQALVLVPLTLLPRLLSDRIHFSAGRSRGKGTPVGSAQWTLQTSLAKSGELPPHFFVFYLSGLE